MLIQDSTETGSQLGTWLNEKCLCTKDSNSSDYKNVIRWDNQEMLLLLENSILRFLAERDNSLCPKCQSKSMPTSNVFNSQNFAAKDQENPQSAEFIELEEIKVSPIVGNVAPGPESQENLDNNFIRLDSEEQLNFMQKDSPVLTYGWNPDNKERKSGKKGKKFPHLNNFSPEIQIFTRGQTLAE
jgi:hypothetical protein